MNSSITTKRHNRWNHNWYLEASLKGVTLNHFDGLNSNWSLISHTVWPSSQLGWKREFECDKMKNKFKKQNLGFGYQIMHVIIGLNIDFYYESGGIHRVNSTSSSPVFRWLILNMCFIIQKRFTSKSRRISNTYIQKKHFYFY